MVKGVRELNKAVAAMPKRVEIACRKAMEKGAQELVDMMKRLVPVSIDGSHGRAPGTLRDSIGWTWGAAPAGSKVIAQTNQDERGLRITVYAGSKEAFYAAWQEFGTKSGNPAQPYFFPSYRALRKRIQSRIKREMKKAIKFVGPVTQGEA